MATPFNSAQIRQSNLRTLLLAVRDKGPVSKPELQAYTQLSWGAVSLLTGDLERMGYIVPLGKRGGAVGRKASEYVINTSDNFAIGIELHALGIRLVVTDLLGKPQKQFFQHILQMDYEGVTDVLFELTDSALKSMENRRIVGIGIAAQGVVDYETKTSLYFPRVRGWENVPLGKLFEERYNIKTLVMHDPNCILDAEKHFGTSGLGKYKNAALLRIDKGIGMAMMIDGQVNILPSGAEIGHICVNYNGPRCVCGNYGCLSEYASLDGIVRRYYEAVGNGPQSGTEAPPADHHFIATRAQAGDQLCRSLFDMMGSYLGVALSTVCNLFPLEQIVLYGEATDYKNLFDQQLRQSLYDHLYLKREIQIRYSTLNVQAPAVGAALSVCDSFLRKSSFPRQEKRNTEPAERFRQAFDLRAGYAGRNEASGRVIFATIDAAGWLV